MAALESQLSHLALLTIGATPAMGSVIGYLFEKEIWSGSTASEFASSAVSALASATTMYAAYMIYEAPVSSTAYLMVGASAAAGHYFGDLLQNRLQAGTFNLMDAPRGVALGVSLALGYLATNAVTRSLAFTAGILSVLSVPIEELSLRFFGTNAQARDLSVGVAAGVISGATFWALGSIMKLQFGGWTPILIFSGVVAVGSMLQEYFATELEASNSIFNFSPSVAYPAIIAIAGLFAFGGGWGDFVQAF